MGGHADPRPLQCCTGPLALHANLSPFGLLFSCISQPLTHPYHPPVMVFQGHDYKGDSHFKAMHSMLQAVLKKANVVREAQGKPPRANDLLQDMTYKTIYHQCRTMFSTRWVAAARHHPV